MDQRLFLAIGLSMLVLIGYYTLFPPPTPKRPPPEQPAASATGPGTVAPGVPATGAPGTALAPTPMAVQPGQPRPPATDASAPAPVGRTIAVRTPLYEARINTRAGVLSAFELREYRVAKENIDWADLITPLRSWLKKPEIDPDARENMAPQSLIGNDALGLRFVGEDSLTRDHERLLYDADQKDLRIDAGGAARTLTLKSGDLQGLAIEKRLTFRPDTYIVDYSVSVVNYGEQSRVLRVANLFGEGPQGAKQPLDFRGTSGPIWRAEDDLDTEDAEDVAAGLIVRTPAWVGIADTYFITAARAASPISHAFYEAAERPLPDDDTIWIAGYGMELPQVQLEPGKMITSEFQLYMGPKNVDDMAKFGDQLETSLDLTLDILAQPMLALMRWFHSFTGNYGVAIILLTIVVRVLLFPLTYRGMLNIKRMQKLQPRMVALREKFKNDKERINKEMIGLYRKHKMNPLGGCLPIALQIPIFFALYSALLGAIELRHEPFMLWIQDLSAQDGLYVTPILMGGSMLLQQKMTPAVMDATQAKIMMWMPVIFTFFMLTFPSGLVVYWLTSNTLSIAQQMIINRIKVPEPQD